jgi:hypothetical protein
MADAASASAPARHDRLTIIAIAVIAGALSPFLHEALGHGVVSWLRGDLPTQLTSNHLSDDIPDRLVSAGGTIVNLIAGGCAALAMRRIADDTWRFAAWVFATISLFTGAGYFIFSGALGVGDWQQIVDGTSHEALLRAAMVIGGVALYVAFAWRQARAIVDYAPDVLALWIIPYLAAAGIECLAGAFDPLGMQLFLLSTIPATFGGSSGFTWAHRFVADAPGPRTRVVARKPALWIIAVVVGIAYVAILGPGVSL